MIVYLDTSVLLGKILKDSRPLKEWGKWDAAVSSALTHVEANRKIHRLRLVGKINDDEMSECQKELFSSLDQCYLMDVSNPILNHAARSFPTVIGTLDAIHLSSALTYQEQTEVKLTFLTHDKQLGRGAMAMGLDAKGF